MKQLFYILFGFCLTFISLQSAAQEKGRLKVGLVLGGGGAKGAAHIGVLKVLEEVGLPVDYIAGTSIGSIVGGLYACGYRSETLDSLFRAQNWPNLFADAAKISRYNPGLLKGDKVVDMLVELIGNEDTIDFKKLPIPFSCVAVDVDKTEEVVLDHGVLAEAMRSSMSIPLVFQPITMDGTRLVDGGILNNLPVDVVKAMGADVVIAVDLTQHKRATQEVEWKQEKGLRWLLQWVKERPDLIKYNENRSQVDVYINPNLKGYTAASFLPKKISSMIQKGLEAGTEMKEALIELKKKLYSPILP